VGETVLGLFGVGPFPATPGLVNRLPFDLLAWIGAER